MKSFALYSLWFFNSLLHQTKLKNWSLLGENEPVTLLKPFIDCLRLPTFVVPNQVILLLQQDRTHVFKTAKPIINRTGYLDPLKVFHLCRSIYYNDILEIRCSSFIVFICCAITFSYWTMYPILYCLHSRTPICITVVESSKKKIFLAQNILNWSMFNLMIESWEIVIYIGNKEIRSVLNGQ